MNPGGEPERDDTGLPPVDIEIPDDARELDRDMQAYYRELRAQRRRDRRGRWHRSLGKDGILLPLLACCLILALITGTLLTVFTATSDQSLSNLPGSGSTTAGQHSSGSAKASSGGRSPAASAGPAAPDLVKAVAPPSAVIAASGAAPIAVSHLRNAMLVLVPPGCNCGRTLGWLANVALAAHAPAYVVYSPATKVEVEQLYGQLDSRVRGTTVVLAEETDGTGVLTSSVRPPASIRADELTAILVGPSGTATWASHLSTTDNQASLVQAITGSSG